MKRTYLAVLAVAAAGGIGAAWAFPPEKPCDPRPLMKDLEKRVTADKFTFAVFGDAELLPPFKTVLAAVEAAKPDFALVMGDMVTTGGDTKQYDQLETQFGPFMRKIPSWPCYGNHEEKGRGAAQNFMKFYGLNNTYFAFDFRNIRVITLEMPMTAEIDPVQAKWLEEQLAEGARAGKLLFVRQHSPCYTIGARDRQHNPNKPSNVTRLCEKYKVVADFAGHDHIYYRTKRGGVNYIVQGGGGDWMYPLRRENEAIKGDVYFGGLPKPGKPYGSTGWKLHNADGTEKSYKDPQYQFLLIEVDGPKVTGKAVTAGGEVLDTFTLTGGAETPATGPSAKACTCRGVRVAKACTCAGGRTRRLAALTPEARRGEKL